MSCSSGMLLQSVSLWILAPPSMGAEHETLSLRVMPSSPMLGGGIIRNPWMLGKKTYLLRDKTGNTHTHEYRRKWFLCLFIHHGRMEKFQTRSPSRASGSLSCPNAGEHVTLDLCSYLVRYQRKSQSLPGHLQKSLPKGIELISPPLFCCLTFSFLFWGSLGLSLSLSGWSVCLMKWLMFKWDKLCVDFRAGSGI